MEAISHLRQGLELLQTSRDPERVQREVDMLIALGASLIATKGYAAPEVGQTYLRREQLCQHLEDPHQLFPVLRGLWQLLCRTCRVSDGARTGRAAPDPRPASPRRCHARGGARALGTTLFFWETSASAHTHFTQGIALYDPQQHRASAFLYGEDAGVVCRSSCRWALWYLGYPDQGLARSQEAVTLAQQTVAPL